MKSINNSIQDIRKRILEEKNQLDLSYSDLQKSTGISSSTLQRYLTGETEKFPLEAIISLCNAVGLDAGVVLGWEKSDWDDTPPEPKKEDEHQMKFKFAETKVLCQGFEEMPPETRAMIMSMFNAAYAQFKQQQGKDEDDDTADET